jgi:hypothetical protein
LHEELQRFVTAGFTPLEALQTATLNPARFFQMEDQLGTIEQGKIADLVFLDANPLEDIRNTQKRDRGHREWKISFESRPAEDSSARGGVREERATGAARKWRFLIVTACELSSTYHRVIRKGKTEESLRFCY